MNVGASISKMSSTYDNKYALWLYAEKKIKINSFYVRANKTGYIKLGLYNDQHQLLASKRVYVTKGKKEQVYLSNFIMSKSGSYYLAIEDIKDISLCYHSLGDSVYTRCQSEFIQVIGSSIKGSFTKNRSYYQYFYDINYTVLE